MQLIEHPSEDLWREALTDPGATFFHTPEWSRLMAEAFPGTVEPSPAGFRFPDGAVAVLPMIRVKRFRGLTRSFYSMFPGVYGGPICGRELAHQERLAINEWLADRKGMRCFCMTAPGVPNPVPTGAREVPTFTQRLPLEKDMDLSKSDLLSHGKKYSVKRAEREGVQVSRAESMDSWRDYYRAYVASMGRWRAASVYRYPLRFFEAMAEDRSGGVALWMATVDGNPAAGAVILSCGRHIVTWHEASFAEYHRTGVNDYLHVKIIEDAARRGLPHFDFNPSGGHRGVEEYKASFGAEKVPLETWIRETAWVRIAKRFRGILKR